MLPNFYLLRAIIAGKRLTENRSCGEKWMHYRPATPIDNLRNEHDSFFFRLIRIFSEWCYSHPQGWVWVWTSCRNSW